MDIEECIDYCSNFVNVDDARSDLARINAQRQHLLWFLAELINERETKKEGYSMPVRWQCLRPDLQVKYIDEAMQIVAAWWADEETARFSREESDRVHARDYKEFIKANRISINGETP